MAERNVWLITGASRGLGVDLANAAHPPSVFASGAIAPENSLRLREMIAKPRGA